MASVWPLYHEGLIGGVAEMVVLLEVLLEGYPISTTLELCQSDHRVLGHLLEQGPSPQIAQFGQADSFRNSLGGSKLLPFKNDGGHCVLGNLQ